MGLISFEDDTKLALSTVKWFDHTYGTENGDNYHPNYQNFRFTKNGGHLRPLGFPVANSVINFPDTFKVPIIELASNRFRDFEKYVVNLFKMLETKER